MLIKFKAPDPRAGNIARMDSLRGQHFIDIGAAVRLKEDGDEASSPPVPSFTTLAAEQAKAGEQLVAGKASDVIASLEGATDGDLLSAALAAEQAKGGSARKKVVEALEATIEALKQTPD